MNETATNREVALVTPSENLSIIRLPVTQISGALCKLNTPLKCATNGGMTLSAIKSEVGELEVFKFIARWILNCQDFLNLSQKMNDVQVAETSRMIATDFWMLNVADVALVFSMAKKGYFGTMYGRIDGQIIYQWFTKYLEQRYTSCEENSIITAKSAAVTKQQAVNFFKLFYSKKNSDEHK